MAGQANAFKALSNDAKAMNAIVGDSKAFSAIAANADAVITLRFKARLRCPSVPLPPCGRIGSLQASL